jgi:hypothetical protein
MRACWVQASANPEQVAVFLYQDGLLRGPAGFSTMGMRIQNEQSGSSSLFAQPMAIQPIPEGVPVSTVPVPEAEARATRDVLETRLETALAQLASHPELADAVLRQGHMALATRWYYRPQQKRIGEIFVPDASGQWPIKAFLRGIGRVAAAALRPPTTPEPAPDLPNDQQNAG